MIVGYSRVSSADQCLDLQMDALRAAGCERIYADKMSGAETNRPELQKCLAQLKKGDILVIFKFDRLGRSLKHLVNTVLDLNDRGVDLVVTSMAIDTRTPHGRLVFGVLASVAEFERSMIKERQAAGIAAAKARGARFGRPLTIPPETMEKAVSAVASGKGVPSVARELGISRSGLYAHINTRRRSMAGVAAPAPDTAPMTA